MKRSVKTVIIVLLAAVVCGAGLLLYLNRSGALIKNGSVSENSIPGEGDIGIMKTAFVFDTDAGTDDAAAFLLIRKLGLKPDYIVATGGNASAEGALRNSIILKKYLGLDSVIVRGYEAKLSTEKNTFHGEDGLANISAQMISDLSITEEDLSSYIGLDTLKKELSGYDRVIYIVVGPVSTLADIVEDEGLRGRISKVYLMGGGINEFNCSHDTEFNFSKNPQGVKTVLESGLDMTLFTLDLTNHQRITEEQISGFEKTGRLPEYIAMLRYNMKANIEYNGIDAAVLHDTMPVLWYYDQTPFTFEDTRIICDEYGHIEKSDDGYPVRIMTGVDEYLLFDALRDCFENGIG